MLEKLKKMILPLVLGFFIFNVAESNILTQNELQVHANMPSITVQGGKINIKPIEPKSANEFFNSSLSEYREIIVFLSGIGTICMILFFILNFIKLGSSQGNPQVRQKAVVGLIVSGIATACLGSVTLIVGMFYSML